MGKSRYISGMTTNELFTHLESRVGALTSFYVDQTRTEERLDKDEHRRVFFAMAFTRVLIGRMILEFLQVSHDSSQGLVPKKAYKERSPIHHTDKLDAPVIFFQGLEDKIVPPNQAEKMVEALRKKGLPVAYVTFAEEGHGFRQAANIKRALDSELYFYAQVFGFELADDVEPLEIENL